MSSFDRIGSDWVQQFAVLEFWDGSTNYLPQLQTTTLNHPQLDAAYRKQPLALSG